jgi:hypothetical protein
MMRKINLSGYVFEKESGEVFIVLEINEKDFCHLLTYNINFSLYVRKKLYSIFPKVFKFKILKEKIIKAKENKKTNPLNPLNKTNKEKFIDYEERTDNQRKSKLTEALDVIENLGTNETEDEFADDIGKENPADKLNKKKKKHIIRPEILEWKSNDFLEYMHQLFVNKYNIESYEFNQYAPGRQSKSEGKLFTVVKQSLITFFSGQGMDNIDLKEYIDWMFIVKAEQLGFPIQLSTITSRSMMTEWQYWKTTSGKKTTKKRMTRFEAAKMNIKKRK